MTPDPQETVFGPHATTHQPESVTDDRLCEVDVSLNTTVERRPSVVAMVDRHFSIGPRLVAAVGATENPQQLTLTLLGPAERMTAIVVHALAGSFGGRVTACRKRDARSAADEYDARHGAMLAHSLPLSDVLRAGIEADAGYFQYHWGNNIPNTGCALPADVDVHRLHGCSAGVAGPWWDVHVARRTGALADPGLIDPLEYNLKARAAHQL